MGVGATLEHWTAATGGVLHPELAGLLPVLYPNVFPNLKAYSKPRADLAAILLTGIPAGVVTFPYLGTSYDGFDTPAV